MSLPNSPAAYDDCYSFFERAANTTSGIRTPFGDKATASIFQLRLHNARRILRDQSCRTYPRDHKLHNTCEFDNLQVTLREDTDGEWWVYCRPHGIKLDYIEELDSEESAHAQP